MNGLAFQDIQSCFSFAVAGNFFPKSGVKFKL
jgi:hypothetical protein